MYNPPRLVLAYVAERGRRGRRLRQLCRGHRADRARRPGAGVSRRATRLGGGRFEIRGRFVLNAAGPYAEWILAGSLGRGLTPPTPFSRDAYFIVRRPLIEGDHALTVPAITTDRDAIVSRGGRHLFLVPWRGVTLVGVWHKVYQGHPDDYEITEAELAAWIAEINGAYRGLDLTLSDVALGSAGLVPYGESDPDAAELKFAHRSRIVDHRAERGLDGLLTLIGVRYTTGPVEASEAVDLVSQRLDRRVPAVARRDGCRSTAAASPTSRRWLPSCRRRHRASVSRPSLLALAHNHGTLRIDRAVVWRQSRPDWARTLPGSEVLGAEIVHAARDEMAVTLADAVFRRTDLSTTGDPGDGALRAAARIMGECLGWDPPQVEAELAYVRSRLRLAASGRALLAEPKMARRARGVAATFRKPLPGAACPVRAREYAAMRERVAGHGGS